MPLAVLPDPPAAALDRRRRAALLGLLRPREEGPVMRVATHAKVRRDAGRHAA